MGTKVKEPLTRTEIRARNRRDLIQAARELIVERGYHATQLEEIASRVGLTKGAVYSIFGSKHELLVAVVRDNDALLQPLAAALQEAPGTAEDVLERLADLMLALAQDPDARQITTFQLEFVTLTMRIPELLDVGRTIEENGIAAISAALNGRPTRGGNALSDAEADEISRHALAMLQGLALSAIAVGWTPSRTTVLAALDSLVQPGRDDTRVRRSLRRVRADR